MQSQLELFEAETALAKQSEDKQQILSALTAHARNRLAIWNRINALYRSGRIGGEVEKEANARAECLIALAALKLNGVTKLPEQFNVDPYGNRMQLPEKGNASPVEIEKEIDNAIRLAWDAGKDRDILPQVFQTAFNVPSLLDEPIRQRLQLPFLDELLAKYKSSPDRHRFRGTRWESEYYAAEMPLIIAKLKLLLFRSFNKDQETSSLVGFSSSGYLDESYIEVDPIVWLKIIRPTGQTVQRIPAIVAAEVVYSPLPGGDYRVLRTVEEIPLDEEVLDNLPKLIFEMLPDGQYQIWLQEPGEKDKRFVMDVTIRDGRPAHDKADASDRPPSTLRAKKQKDTELDAFIEEAESLIEPAKRTQPAAGLPSVTAIMKRYDGDRNGVLSRKEVDGPSHVRQFVRWDTNRDGLVSNRDIVAFRLRFGMAADGTNLKQATIERSSRLNSDSWSIVTQLGLPAAKYQSALELAVEANSLVPGYGEYLNTLGVAQYRVQKYKEAQATLARSTSLNASRFSGWSPYDLVFLAMTRFQLGEQKQAADLLKNVKAIAAQAKKKDAELDAFIREAESLIQSPQKSKPAA
jgi:tetratricopeptide (TPR) repeat protein